jgi:sphinganine-1-phosphate aldolase
MKIPAVKTKVDAELARVKADIRAKLVAEGPKVIRHLALPAQGKSKEWIIAEMQRMDDESTHSNAWKNGKISGAIYRTSDH